MFLQFQPERFLQNDAKVGQVRVKVHHDQFRVRHVDVDQFFDLSHHRLFGHFVRSTKQTMYEQETCTVGVFGHFTIHKFKYFSCQTFFLERVSYALKSTTFYPKVVHKIFKKGYILVHHKQNLMFFKIVILLLQCMIV